MAESVTFSAVLLSPSFFSNSAVQHRVEPHSPIIVDSIVDRIEKRGVPLFCSDCTRLSERTDNPC
jgi:hypothetical protein